MSDAVDRALSENHALIAAILEHQSSGRTVPAVALLERLQINLEYIASVAEHGFSEQQQQSSQQQHQIHHQQPHHSIGNTTTLPNISTLPLPHLSRIAPAPQHLHQQQTPQPATMYWTPDEHARFEEGMRLYGASGKDGKPNFKAIAVHVGSRTPVQVRSHHQKFQKKLDRQGTCSEHPNHNNNNNNNNKLSLPLSQPQPLLPAISTQLPPPPPPPTGSPVSNLQSNVTTGIPHSQPNVSTPITTNALATNRSSSPSAEASVSRPL